MQKKFYNAPNFWKKLQLRHLHIRVQADKTQANFRVLKGWKRLKNPQKPQKLGKRRTRNYYRGEKMLP